MRFVSLDQQLPPSLVQYATFGISQNPVRPVCLPLDYNIWLLIHVHILSCGMFTVASCFMYNHLVFISYPFCVPYSTFLLFHLTVVTVLLQIFSIPLVIHTLYCSVVQMKMCVNLEAGTYCNTGLSTVRTMSCYKPKYWKFDLVKALEEKSGDHQWLLGHFTQNHKHQPHCGSREIARESPTLPLSKDPCC